MSENNLDKILVENNNGKIIGVFDETNLLKCVMEKSFKHKIKDYFTSKIKSVSHDLDFKKLLNIFKKRTLYSYIKKRFHWDDFTK